MIDRLGATGLVATVALVLGLLWTGPQGHPVVAPIVRSTAVQAAPAVTPAEPSPTAAPEPELPAPAVAPESPQIPHDRQDAPLAPVPPPVATPPGPIQAPDAWAPPLAGPQAASPLYIQGTLAGYQCWNPQGYPLPQAGSACPVGWGGRPPEHPLPITFTGGIVP